MSPPQAISNRRTLRVGFVTSSLEDGADTLKIMDVTRHKRVATLRIAAPKRSRITLERDSSIPYS
jgi:hypothetical protein